MDYLNTLASDMYTKLLLSLRSNDIDNNNYLKTLPVDMYRKLLLSLRSNEIDNLF